MLKVRIVACLTYNNGILYRTKKFRPDYLYTSTQLDFWEVDEAIVLDVSRETRGDLSRALGDISERAFIPIAAGGGVRSIEDVNRLLRMGADKITINTAALERPALIGELAEKFGSQAIVLSIDARDGKVYGDCGRWDTGRKPAEWAKEGTDRGAGEVLITSMEKDGSLLGYDLPLCESIANAVSVPVIFCGGAGNWSHFEQAINAGACAAATTCIYHFTSRSLRAAKEHLASKGYPVRLD